MVLIQEHRLDIKVTLKYMPITVFQNES